MAAVGREQRAFLRIFIHREGEAFMKKHLSAAGTAIAALIGMTGVQQSASAAAAATSDTGLEEIVVTAEKRDSTVQATAISMTAISGEQLAAQGIATVEDIAAKVPGISIRTAGPGQTEYEMRGLSAGGGSAATVGFYLDETPLSANAVALNGRTVIDPDLFDLNHVEVLRGPQGTLYGSGSMGGTIKLVTNQPALDKWDAATDTYVSDTSHGSTNGGGSLMLNVPIGDIAAFRLVGTAKYLSGWIDRIFAQPGEFPAPTNPAGTATAPVGCVYYCNRGDVSAMPVAGVVKGSNLERFASGRGTLLVKPADDFSIALSEMYQVIRADGYNAFQENPGGLAIEQPYDQPEPYHDYFGLTSLKIAYDFEGASLTSATSYWRRDVLQSQDATEALQNINNLTKIVNGVAVPNYIQSLYQEDDPTTQFSEELRLTSSGSGPFDWVGGLYFAKLDSGYITYNQDAGFATTLSCGLASAANPVAGSCPVSSTYNPNSTYRYPNPGLPQYPSGQAANPNGVVFNDNNPNVLKQEAVFGEVNYKIQPDLRLTAGIRYFHYSATDFAHQSGLGTAAGNQDATILAQSDSGSAVLPKLNLSYEPTSDLTLYGTVAKGSRPGGFNLPIPLPNTQTLTENPNSYNCGNNGTNTVYVTSQPSFGPDSVWSFELGEKSRLDDRRFTFNADVYYIEWKNIQQVLSLTCGYPYNTNAGNAKSYGPEAEFSAVITQGLTFDLSGAYTQAYISDPTAAAIGSGITPGTRVLNVPKYTAVAGLNYSAPLGAGLNGLFHIASSLVGPSEDQAAVRQELPSYTLIDARTGVDADHWGAYLFGTNLTNKVAYQTIDNTVFAWQTYAITRVSTNQPRTIGVDFRYKF